MNTSVPINAKVTGLKELEKALSKFGKEYGDPKFAMQAMRPALKAAAQEFEGDIASKTPVDTGALKDKVAVKVKKTGKKDLRVHGQDSVLHATIGYHWRTGSDGPMSFQAVSVEYGNAHIMAHAPLRSSMDANAMTAVNTFKQKLGPAMEKKAKSLNKKLGK